MSREVRVGTLAILLLSVGLWVAVPGARGHAYHLMVANDTLDAGLTSEPVHATRWVAQSFLTPTNVSDFAVSRVSLHVADVGISDLLYVSVRADNGGEPAATNLTEGSVDGPTTRDWVDVDLSPHATLMGGQTYWIVSHSREPADDGYNWFHSAVYGDGEAASSSDGATWNALLVDLTFRVYGYETPDFEYAVTATPAVLEPGNATVLEVWFNNTGDTTAEKLWVNVTYPAALIYVTDDAADEGGVRTGTSYEFTDVAPGNHSFNITAEADGGVADGTVATVQFTFEAADHAGAPTTHDEREVSVTIHNAILGYDAGVSPTTLRPDETAVLRLVFNNSGNGSAAKVWVNLTLPAEVRYVSDDAGAIGGVLSGTYHYEFTNKSAGEHVFNVTVAAEGGTLHGTVATTNVTFEGQDQGGAPLNATAMDLEVTIANADLDTGIEASATAADPGDQVTFRGTVSNGGGDAATNLTLTGSVDPNATYLSSSPSGTYDDSTRTVTWTLSSLDAGASADVEWTVEVKVGTDDNATVAAWFRTEYEDATGATMPAENVTASLGVQVPVFDPALVLDPTEAERGDEVAAYLYYNNTGSATSPQAWANWTLHGHYELVGLVPDLPYVLTTDGFSVHLTDVAPGDHFFVAKLEVLPAGPDGLPMEVEVNWTAQDGNGNALPSSQRTATAMLRAPAFDPVLRVDTTQAERGDRVRATLYYNNTGSVTAQWAWVNWSFADHFLFVALSRDLPFLVTEDGIAVLDQSLEPGPHALTVTLQTAVGSPDQLVMPLQASFAPTDGKGEPLPETSHAATVRLLAPAFQPVLALDRASAERGDTVTAVLFYNNTGSVSASAAWANWTLGGHYDLLSVDPAVPLQDRADGFALALGEVEPGLHALTVRLQVVRGLEDGLAMPLRLTWEARDGGGYALASADLEETTELLAPAAVLSLEAGAPAVPVGTTLVLNATLRNAGRAPLEGQLELVLPDGVRYAGSDGQLEEVEEEGRVRWSLAPLAPGDDLRLGIRLRVTAASPGETLRITLHATDGRGTPPVTVSSNAVPVEFLPTTSPDYLAWWPAWTALAALGVALPILLLRRRGGEDIEEVFVVDRGGVLLAHRSRSLLSSLDHDLVAGMLTAVQEFVKDTFSRGRDEAIRSLAFGDRTILVERQPHHYLAAVCREPSEELERRMRTVAREIEERFGSLLEAWDGSMEAVQGVQDILPRLWVAKRRRVPEPPA